MLLVLGLVAVFLGLLLALAASGSIVGQRRQARRQLAVVASVSRLRSDYRHELDVPFARESLCQPLMG